MATSDYYIGKGIVSFQKTGDVAYRDVGNVPEFEFTPALEELEHFSSRSGVRSKDRTIVIEKSGSLRIVLEEFTMSNLALAFLGTLTEDTSGSVIDIFAENSITGAVRFVGQNEVGARFQVDFPNVSFIPSGSVGLITDEWGQIELTGDVLVDETGSFGTVTLLALEGEATA